MQNKIVTIIGGSGFVGGYITKELTDKGYLVQIISRDPEKSSFFKTIGNVGTVYLKPGNIYATHTLKALLKHSDTVINLVGIMYESRKHSFYSVHINATKHLARICNELNIKNLIHFSALGIDRAVCSNYAKSKYIGEKEMSKECPNSIIMRPSVIFGPEDNFINCFLKIIKLSPIFPLINNGDARFQPVYIKDLAQAVGKILDNPHKYYGKIFELAGAKTYSLRKILTMAQSTIGKHCYLLETPNKLSVALAFLCEFLPKPIFTRDQIRLLKYDNIIFNNNLNLTFKDLGIIPKSLEDMMYLYKMNKKMCEL